MNEDYLWDRTGEPDPEIQQLEQVLGTLRYQPRPLDIPAELAPSHRRVFEPRYLAIAATIALMLLGVGLWLGLQRRQTTQLATGGGKPATTSDGGTTAVVPPKEDKDAPVVAAIDQGKPSRRHANPISRELARSRRPAVNTFELTARERKEAEAAKEQLMLALRVASSKLNFAQKKAQELNSDNQVHNQHKVG